MFFLLIASAAYMICPMQSLLGVLLALVAALLLLPPAIVNGSSPYGRYADCAPTTLACGNLSIQVGYPFRLDNTRPDYCGYPGFLLSCLPVPDPPSIMITIASYAYRVKAVDYSNHLLTLVDPFTAAGPSSCPRLPYRNITLDPSLYEYTDRDQSLTVFINCSAAVSTSHYIKSALHRIPCSSDPSQGNRSYFTVGTQGIPSLSDNCSSTLLVPVSQTAAGGMLTQDADFSKGLQQGFTVRWLAGIGWCRNCIDSGGICGYDYTSLANQTCYCPYGMERGICHTDTGSKFAKKRMIIALIAGISSFLLVILLCLRYHRKISKIILQKKLNNAANEAFLIKYGSLAPKRYTYSDLKKITNSFSIKLGQGGYGIVFKGNLPDGYPVAVKKLSKSNHDGEEFINEVACIGRTSHVNIVRLLGFCLDGSKRALVYEFMDNGSLDKFIFTDKLKQTLRWEQLYDIASGIARGLEYLHRGCNTRIVHFDIKPHNILLDKDLCPKISDFGLAKLCPQKESAVSMAGARGTIGYIAPEVFSRNFGVVTSKSDVYSYGMMVLEMAGGRKNYIDARADNTSEIYFPHWVYEHLERDGDLHAYGVTAETEELARKMILVGLWCIQTMPRDRPSMNEVVDMLEGSVKDLQMPPKPYLSSPARSVVLSSSI